MTPKRPDSGEATAGEGRASADRLCAVCHSLIPEGTSVCLQCAETTPLALPHIADPPPIPKEIAWFQIVRKIGAGGMGVVYEAFDRNMNRRVALKVLSRHHASAERAETRFTREAWIGGKLVHPNIVKVFEIGRTDDLIFYSMELVDGGSLHDVIRRLKESGRDESWGLQAGTREYLTWAISQVIAVARGLGHAHRQGIIHRDLKPMNLLLSRDPCVVKIADFGLAIDSSVMRLTTSGRVMGSVAYMAPEQMRGKTHEITNRTDIYSLGVTLFELLVLQLPFPGNTQELYMNAVLTTEPRRASRHNARVSRDLDIVVGKALEKDSRDRYETAEEFAEDLENVLSFRPIRARPPTLVGRTAKWVRRKPIHAALVLVVGLALPAITALSVRAVQQQRLVAIGEIGRLWQEARLQSLDDRPQEALAGFSEILRRDPENIEALRARSLSCLKLADRETRAEKVEEFRSQALADISKIIELLPDASWPYRVRAFMLKRFGRVGEAERDDQASASRRTRSTSDLELQIDGDLALQAGNFETAVQYLSRAIDQKPGSVEAYLERAQAYEALDQKDRAMIDLHVAGGLMPDAFLAHYELGRLVALSGDFDAAARHYRAALRVHPGEAHAHAGLADVYVRQGKSRAAHGDGAGALRDFQRAQTEARKGVQLDPTLGKAHQNLGASLMEENRLLPVSDPNLVQEALAEYGAVISQFRARGGVGDRHDYRNALTNQCDGFLQLRDFVQAERACLECTKEEPGSADVFYNLAGLYALMNRPDDAFRALEKDLKLGDREVETLASDKWFESLRGDPRFGDLIRRMKDARMKDAASTRE